METVNSFVDQAMAELDKVKEESIKGGQAWPYTSEHALRHACAHKIIHRPMGVSEEEVVKAFVARLATQVSNHNEFKPEE